MDDKRSLSARNCYHPIVGSAINSAGQGVNDVLL